MNPSFPKPDPTDRHRQRRSVMSAALGATVLVSLGIGLRSGLLRSSAAIAEARAADAQPSTFAFFPHAAPRPVPDVTFADAKGRMRDLASFRGKLVLLNVWATWCPPCRREMPTLDRLQAKLGSKDFEVVALSIDRGGKAAVKAFFDEIDVKALALYVDATTGAQGQLGVVGVPTTLLIDREGREIGRVVGPAEWDSPDVIETIRHYLPTRAS